MQLARVIIHLFVLVLFYYAGVLIQWAFDLIVPGSIIGMVLLFLALLWGNVRLTWIEEGAQMLIRHLPLLFIPVTVGVIEYVYVFSGKGLVLFVIALVSTLLVMVTSGAVSQHLALRKERKYE
ncbi:MAG: CidA/LrgA family protein [Bacillaceae bacterium]|nr:CidA/LrgA family protein [Bacillaceae bacterium]